MLANHRVGQVPSPLEVQEASYCYGFYSSSQTLKPRNSLALSAPGRVAEPTPNFPHLWEPDEIDEIEVADEVFGNAGIFEFPHQQLNV